jgi:hypothetical protein
MATTKDDESGVAATSGPDSAPARTDESNAEDARRERKSLEDKIRETEEQLRRLQAKKREADKAEQERNDRAIRALLRTEKLDAVPADTWKAAMAGIRAALRAAGASNL